MRKATRILNDYVTIYMPDHSRAMKGTGYEGYVYEHIIVAEHMLGRPLSEDEVVHHLDFDRANNTITNLLVLLRSQHTKLHSWLNAGAPGWKHSGANGVNSGKPKERRRPYCLACESLLSPKQKHFCSKKCAASLRKRKVPRPSAEELKKDLATMSKEAIGRKYGVSSNAIRKWARGYGILR